MAARSAPGAKPGWPSASPRAKGARPIQLRFAGTIGYVVPGTAHQVALDLRDGTENMFVMEPPAIAIHVWKPGTGIVSHLQPIGDYGPRRPFLLDPAYPGKQQAAPADA